MRRPAYAVLVVLAVLAAGCGGSSKASSTWGGPTGASIAPASALGFVSVNTDKSASQWKNADALLRKFPGRDKLPCRSSARCPQASCNGSRFAYATGDGSVTKFSALLKVR